MAKRNIWKWVDDPITYKRLTAVGAIIVALGGLAAYFDVKSLIVSEHRSFQICRGEFSGPCAPGWQAHIGCPDGDWVAANRPKWCYRLDEVRTVQNGVPGNRCGYNSVVYECQTRGLF
jgi:hypothetical protein